MNEKRLLNILHFKGIPNGKSLRSLINEQNSLRRESLTRTYEMTKDLIQEKYKSEREMASFEFEVEMTKMEADFELMVCDVKNTSDAETLRETAILVDVLMEKKQNLFKNYSDRKRDIHRAMNREMIEARLKYEEQIDKLMQELHLQMDELNRNAVNLGFEMRIKSLEERARNKEYDAIEDDCDDFNCAAEPQPSNND